jgi:ABC-type antimicrobial peptide transport system permease subunit
MQLWALILDMFAKYDMETHELMDDGLLYKYDPDYGCVRLNKPFFFAIVSYFESLDIPVLRGRAIEDSDRAGSPRVVVINETLARLHWPDGDPIGQQIVLGSGPREIVGVVADSRDSGADSDQTVMMFIAADQSVQRLMDWAVEADVPLATLVEPLRTQIRAVDPNVPVYDVMPFDDLIEQSLGGDLIMAKIMGILALVALVLALGGVYGVMAFTVSQRTREMGIRLSLGAQRRTVLSMVVRQGAALVRRPRRGRGGQQEDQDDG